MSELQELRERIGRAEDALSRGANQFNIISDSLDQIKAHLKRQDEVIDTTNSSVSGIVEMWDSGVKGVQFACRAVKAWDWFIAQTLSKRGITILAVALISYRVLFNTFPQWTNYIVVLIKFIEGAGL